MGALITPLIALIRVMVKESPKYIPLILSAISTAGAVVAANVNLDKLEEIKIEPKSLPNLTKAVMQIGYDNRSTVSTDIITSLTELSAALEAYMAISSNSFAHVEKVVQSPSDLNKQLENITTPGGLALLTTAIQDANFLIRAFGSLQNARHIQRIFLTADDGYFDLMKHQTNRIY